jgi:hypothetical protein
VISFRLVGKAILIVFSPFQRVETHAVESLEAESRSDADFENGGTGVSRCFELGKRVRKRLEVERQKEIDKMDQNKLGAFEKAECQWRKNYEMSWKGCFAMCVKF